MSNLRLFTLLLILHLFFLSGVAADDTESDYYYYHGEKIAVEMNDSLLVLYYDSPETGKYLEDKYGLKPGRLEETDELGPFQLTGMYLKNIYVVSPAVYKDAYQRLRNEEKVIDVERVVKDLNPLPITSNFSIYLSDDATEEEARNLAIELGVDFLGSLGWGRWYQLRTNNNSVGDALVCSNLFYESGICKEVDPGFGFRVFNHSITDPGLINQWAVDGINTSTNRDIFAQDAWNITKGKSNIKIGIIDTGIWLDHPEFSSTNFISSYNAYNNVEEHALLGRHGTMVTGIISSNHNSDSIAGVAPNLSIIEVSTRKDNNLSQTEHVIQMSNGIMWAVRNGADILNCSWGMGNTNLRSSCLESALDSALYYGRGGKGCVVIFSAGNRNNNSSKINNDSIEYPGNSNPDILVVGAMDKTGHRDTISKYGTQLDLMAPGKEILTTDFLVHSNTFFYKNYIVERGTSLAAPFVSAVAGLILSESPNMTREQVVELLCRTTQKINNSSDYNISRTYGTWCIDKGYGMIDALHAIYMEYSDMNASSLEYILGCNVNLLDYDNQSETEIVVKGYSSITVNGHTYVGPGSAMFLNSLPDFIQDHSAVHF